MSSTNTIPKTLLLIQLALSNIRENLSARSLTRSCTQQLGLSQPWKSVVWITDHLGMT